MILQLCNSFILVHYGKYDDDDYNMNVFFGGRMIFFVVYENRIETDTGKILSISIMQSICQEFAELLFPLCFDTLHVQFLIPPSVESITT